MHSLIQAVPTYSPTKIVQTVKSLTARHVFAQAPEVKKQLWGRTSFGGKDISWRRGANTATSGVIAMYIRKQGQERDYKQLHKQPLQLELF